MQATVGLLVAKTLTNATANPFLAGGAGSYNPVLALDVFLVQVRLQPLQLDVDHSVADVVPYRDACALSTLAAMLLRLSVLLRALHIPNSSHH